jgi:hypothetical protein
MPEWLEGWEIKRARELGVDGHGGAAALETTHCARPASFGH